MLLDQRAPVLAAACRICLGSGPRKLPFRQIPGAAGNLQRSRERRGCRAAEAENGHGEKCRSMSRTSGSRLCKKGHAQTNRWSAMRFEERYSRTSAGLCILCRKAIIPALVGCKVRPDPMMDKLAAERCEGKSLPECACFRRLPQPRVCKRTESGFSRACSVAECPAIVIGSPKRRRPLIRPLMKQPQAGF